MSLNTMTLDFIQTRARMVWNYEVCYNGHTLYHLSVPFRFIGQEAFVYEADSLLCMLRFDIEQATRTIFKSSVSRIPFNIYNPNNQCIGSIAGFKTKSFGGYIYYNFDLEGTIYTGYMVGMGKQGTFLPLYLKDMLIAQVRKQTVVYDNKDTYKIVVANQDAILPACLFTLYIDLAHFANSGELVIKSKKASYLYTLNKTLKSKYKPNFNN